MRVAKAGVFVWSPDGRIVTEGWELDCEGRHALPDESEVLALMLNHIADAHGLALSIDPAQAEAMTEEALAKMRRDGVA